MEKIRGHFECQECKSVISSDEIPTKCLCGANNFVVIGLNNQITHHAETLSINEATIILGKTYELILKVFDEYVDIPLKHKKLIGIWLIGTYFHEKFSAYPYLILNAMRGSGKSRILKLIAYIGNKGDGKVYVGMTEATIFRHERNKVLTIDENENINSRDKQATRQLLNSAYKKGTAVTRMKKVKKNGTEEQVAESFEPYFPIAMASIKAVEEVLADRAINVTLEKSFNEGIVKKIENFDENEDIKTIKTNLVTMSDVTLWSRSIYKEWNNYIQNKYNNVTNVTIPIMSLNVTQCQEILFEELFLKIDQANILGRNLELFMPLFLVAKAINNEILMDLIDIAKNEVAEKKDEEYANSKDVSVYEFVSALEHNVEYVVKNLVNQFRMFIGDDDSDDPWLNEKWLGHALKRLSLVVNKRRANNARYVILDITKAKEMNSKFKGDTK